MMMYLKRYAYDIPCISDRYNRVLDTKTSSSDPFNSMNKQIRDSKLNRKIGVYIYIYVEKSRKI